MSRVYIIDGKRSYIGIENGMYRHVPAELIGANVLKELLFQHDINDVEAVIAGNAVGAGGNIARLMLLEAGLSETVPAMTVDLQCASALAAMDIAAAKISCGQANLLIAGGFESSSTAPVRSNNPNHPDFVADGDNSYKVAKFSPGKREDMAMLEGAERTALAEHIRREDLDKWVLRSHSLAVKARAEGVLNDVIVQVADGADRDEGIRSRMSERLLAKVPVLLPKGQVLTVANTCLTNDGAAFVALACEQYVSEHCIRPMAEIVDVVMTGGNPLMSPKTAVLAIERLLKKHNMTSEDIDVFECNEAFAVIDELFMRAYPDAVDRYNIFGGALAYGHPYGASGGIITLHAVKALEKTNGEYAVVSVAAAGGIGTAMLIRYCR